MSSLGQTLEATLVLITSADESNNNFGTGFVVYLEQDATLVVTCAHVVDDVGGPDKIKVAGALGEVSVLAIDGDRDVAVLRVAQRLERLELKLQASAAMRGEFHTMGYRGLKGQFLARSLKGELGKRIVMRSTHALTSHKAWDLNLKDVDTLEPGYSGSPVVDEKGVCIAIVSYRVFGGQKGIAISADVLTEVWPNRPGHILSGLQIKPRMNRDLEFQAFCDIVTGADLETKLIVIEGASWMGKTRLIEEYEEFAKDNGLNVVRITLTKHLSIDTFLNRILERYNWQFANYEAHLQTPRPETRYGEKEWYRILTTNFFRDLQQHRGELNLVVLIDKYEAADRPLMDWLDDQFVPSIFRSGLIVVIAGQEEAARERRNEPGQRHFRLDSIPVEHFERYATIRNARVKFSRIRDYHSLLGGRPGDFVLYVDGLVAPKLKS